MNLLRISISLLFMFSMLFVQATVVPGERITKKYEVKPFQSIEFTGSYEVILTQSDVPELKIEAVDEVHDMIEVQVNQGVLMVKVDTKNAILKKTKVYISNPEFEKIHIKGAANLWSTSGIKGKSLEILTSGTGELDLDLQVEYLEAVIHGAGSIKLRGNSKLASMNIEGAGGIKAFALQVEDLELELNGAGSAQVNAKEELAVTIRGLGKVTYEGDPVLSKEVSGIGQLKKR